MYVCGNDDTAEMEGRNWPSPIHRRMIKTEEKGKVVTVVWWTYLNVALTIKHQV